MSQLQDVAKFK